MKGKKKAAKYSDRSQTSGRKTNPALEQGVASSSSAMERPGVNRSRKDTRRRGKISPLTYLVRIEMGRVSNVSSVTFRLRSLKSMFVSVVNSTITNMPTGVLSRNPKVQSGSKCLG